MAELPEEIIMMKKKWREINEEESEAKKKRTEKNSFHRCENCHCYKCCRHVWVCAKCRLEKETFHMWLNQDKQQRERRERGGENSRGKGEFRKESGGGNKKDDRRGEDTTN